METKEQEAKEAWKKKGYEGIINISEFQYCLIEALEKKKLSDTGYDYNLGFNAGLAKAISLVKTITPKKK